METKICPRCGEEKLLNFFPYREETKLRKARYDSHCKSCAVIRSANWRKNNRDRYNEMQRESYYRTIEYQRNRRDKEVENLRFRGYTESLSKNYISLILRQQNPELVGMSIPPELIELKRKSLLARRILKATKTKDINQLIKLSSLTKREVLDDSTGNN